MIEIKPMSIHNENEDQEINQDDALPQNQKKQRKRVLVCVNCQTPLSNRTRCPRCGAKFHDGFIMKLIKKLWRVETR
jgi:rRNA maturation endonuclease Nob1